MLDHWGMQPVRGEGGREGAREGGREAGRQGRRDAGGREAGARESESGREREREGESKQARVRERERERERERARGSGVDGGCKGRRGGGGEVAFGQVVGRFSGQTTRVGAQAAESRPRRGRDRTETDPAGKEALWLGAWVPERKEEREGEREGGVRGGILVPNPYTPQSHRGRTGRDGASIPKGGFQQCHGGRSVTRPTVAQQPLVDSEACLGLSRLVCAFLLRRSSGAWPPDLVHGWMLTRSAVTGTRPGPDIARCAGAYRAYRLAACAFAGIL